MDLRITNFCNNNCLYCLEQSYREKNPYIFINEAEKIMSQRKAHDRNMTFYGGNPLLHPELTELINLAESKYHFESFNILTNTHGVNKNLLEELKEDKIVLFGVYFHSFNKKIHDTIVNGGIDLEELLRNILLIKAYWFNQKVIIHINGRNIYTLARDILILHRKVGIQEFEFVNYFPFDRAYDSYHSLLKYHEDRKVIDSLFETIESMKLDVRFIKFKTSFFWKYQKYLNYKEWVIDQVSQEDSIRISQDPIPCESSERCESCFISEICPSIYARTKEI